MGGPNAPKPSKEEKAAQKAQADMLDFQRGLLERQSKQQDLLAPILYKQNNIEPIMDGGGTIIGFRDMGPTKEQMAYQEALDAQMRNLRFAEKMTPLQLRQQGYNLVTDAEGNPVSIDVVPGGAADLQAQYQAQQLATGKQQQEVNSLMLDRTKKALAGELPVDPSLQRNITSGRALLEESLRKNLGPGYSTSTPGITALNDYDQRAGELMYAAEHGEISAADQLAIAGQQGGIRPSGVNSYGPYRNEADAAQGLNPFSSAGSTSGRSQQLLGAVQAPFSNTGGFAELGGAYGNSAQQMAQRRAQQFQMEMASFANEPATIFSQSAMREFWPMMGQAGSSAMGGGMGGM